MYMCGLGAHFAILGLDPRTGELRGTRQPPRDWIPPSADDSKDKVKQRVNLSSTHPRACFLNPTYSSSPFPTRAPISMVVLMPHVSLCYPGGHATPVKPPIEQATSRRTKADPVVWDVELQYYIPFF